MSAKLPKKMIEELDLLTAKLLEAGVEEREKIMSRLQRYEQTGKLPLDALVRMADEDNPSVSMYAITALGRNGDPKAVSKLAELVEKHKKGNPLMLETVVEALGRAGSRDGTETLMGLLGIRTGWKGKLLGRRSRGDVAEQEGPLYEQITLSVLRALEQIGDPRAATLLGDFLTHEDPLVRWHAIENMVAARCTSFNERLRTLARHDETELVREKAEIALERLEEDLPPNLNN